MKRVAVSVAIATLTLGVEAQTIRPPGHTFPFLPNAIAQDVQTRDCKLPNSASKGLIYGEVFKPGQFDWAILCSTKKSASLLVYPSGSHEQVAVPQTVPRGFITCRSQRVGQPVLLQ